MTPAQTVPAIRCRCCGNTLDAIYQPPICPGYDGHWLITCIDERCPLWGYTLSARTYGERDLSAYMTSGQRRLDSLIKEELHVHRHK
jgi:hypothetical protein